MYICLCQAVTEVEIKNVIEEGSSTLNQIQKKCQAGRDCGSCIGKIRKIISRSDAENNICLAEPLS